jgi:hypothetical protein
MDLWAALNSYMQFALVIGHNFDDTVGGFLKEATYEVTARLVTMSVRGNAEPYRHQLLPWQRGWRGPNGECLEAHTITCLGGFTSLWTVTAGYRRQPLTLPTFGEVLADTTYAGPVQSADNIRGLVNSNTKVVNVKLDMHRLESAGSFLYTESLISGVPYEIAVPKTRVSEVAVFVAGKPRTPELWASAMAKFGNRSQGDRVPSELAPRALIVAVALGFVNNLDFEIDVMYTMHHNYSRLYRLQASLVDFVVPRVHWLGKLVVVGCLLVLVFALAEVYTHGILQTMVLPLIGSTVLCIVVLTFLLARCVNRKWRDTQVRNWRAHYANDPPEAGYVSGFVPLLDDERHLPPTHYVAPAPAELVEQIKSVEPSKRWKENQRGLTLDGVGISNAICNSIADTRATEDSAICNRVMVNSQWPTLKVLRSVTHLLRKSPYYSFKGRVDYGRSAVQRWIEGLKKKGYSARYILDAQAAAEMYEGQPPPDGLKGDPFIKSEKSSKIVRVEGQEAQKPRIIVAPTVEVKVQTGPYVEQIYKYVRKYWQLPDSKVFYASGVSLDAIGERVDRFLDLHGDKVQAFLIDMSALDATLKLPLQCCIMENVYMAKFGMPTHRVKWVYALVSAGTMPAGEKYVLQTRVAVDTESTAMVKWISKFLGLPLPPIVKIEDVEHYVIDERQMCSGRADTNLMDTIATSIPTVQVVELIEDFLLLQNGDDGFLLVPDGACPPDLAEQIANACRDMGFKPKVQQCAGRHEWEFCSKLFWKGVHNGRSQTVLGPKPGRGIVRKGLIVNKPGVQSLRSALISLANDAHHVPFLGEVAKHDLALAAAQKLKVTGRPEQHELHTSKRFEIDPLNWVMFESRYGYSREAIELTIENYKAAVTSLPGLYSSEVIATMTRVDE